MRGSPLHQGVTGVERCEGDEEECGWERLDVDICVMRKARKVNICVIFHLSGGGGEIGGVVV